MRKNILAVIILACLAVFAGLPANAALRTKITLTISETHHDDTLSHEVSADLIDERGVFTGSNTETRTFADSHGRSVTETETEFRNIHGELLMSADVTITARSDDFTVISDETFAETFSVDVTLLLYDDSYDGYEYTLGIEGLPEWLYASGELLSMNRLSAGTSTHHHEFTISGTPGESFDKARLKFTALVYVSGDMPVMRVTASKDVNISAEIVPKPPDVVPKLPEYLDTKDVEPPNSGTGAISLMDIVRKMTTEQKAAVKTLKVNTNIKDLIGLEEFTNLERLDLTEATSLEYVDLSSNSTVKSVDVSGNTALKILTLTGSNVETLDASGCENLEEMNVAGCETLKILDVSNTPITRLDVEGCISLEVLYCSDCRLVELNITGCESLIVIDCHNNSLHMLDVYMFDRLYELICYNQRITGWKIGRSFSFTEQFEKITASDDKGNGSNATGAENIINLKAWNSEGEEISAERSIYRRCVIQR